MTQDRSASITFFVYHHMYKYYYALNSCTSAAKVLKSGNIQVIRSWKVSQSSFLSFQQQNKPWHDELVLHRWFAPHQILERVFNQLHLLGNSFTINLLI